MTSTIVTATATLRRVMDYNARAVDVGNTVRAGTRGARRGCTGALMAVLADKALTQGW